MNSSSLVQLRVQMDLDPSQSFRHRAIELGVVSRFSESCGVDARHFAFIVVPRRRGQQLKEPAQLDGWLRDGSAAYVESLGVWGP